ncbi:MAG: FG-GAP repeat protein [Rhodospirillales bacterium]|nr:FG-GAP repeat protein [Rhodospirillales bacterium]MCB9996655.1 FG-GAP repeat protein [Rhodospirillales bacterium]
MARTPEDDWGGQTGTSSGNQHIISANGQDVIDLPHSDFVKNADILRDGQDLVLEAPDGSVIVIEGYFNADPAPLLQAPDGQALTPQLVQSFAHHAGPVQYAQAGSMSDESPVGAIQEVSGKATVTRTDGTTEEITLGTPIFQGDIVETEGEGAVNIVFIDETSLAVSNNAKLAIDEYVFDPASESGTTDVSVLRGLFVFTSGLIGRDDPDDVNIDTPMGSIGIRGTVIVGNADTGQITVMEGAIVLRGFNGNQITLAQQFETGRFDPVTGDVIYVGKAEPGVFTNDFSSLKSVSPGLFTAIDDTADNNGNDDNGSQQDNDPQQDDNESSSASDAAADDSENPAEGSDDAAGNEDTGGEELDAADDAAAQDAATEGDADAGTSTDSSDDGTTAAGSADDDGNTDDAAGDPVNAAGTDTSFDGGNDSGFDTSAGTDGTDTTSGTANTTTTSGTTAGGTAAGSGSTGGTAEPAPSTTADSPLPPPPSVLDGTPVGTSANFGHALGEPGYVRLFTNGIGGSINLNSYFSDPNGDPLSFAIANTPNVDINASVVSNTLSFMISNSFVGTETIDIIATDPGGNAAVATFTLDSLAVDQGGGAGADSPTSLAAGNVIMTYDDNDTITIDDDDVTAFGGSGDDIFYITSDNNEIYGNIGTDTVDYGSYGVLATNGLSVTLNSLGPTPLTHDFGTDVLWGIENIGGSIGDDTIVGDATNNALNGHAGNDTIFGGLGDDSILGEAGNDTLNGGLGDDVIIGGAGDDTFKAVAGDGNDTIDGGTDSGLPANGDTYDATIIASNITVDVDHATDNVMFVAQTDTVSNVEKFLTGSGNDTFIVTDAAAADHYYDGGSGFDIYDASPRTFNINVDLTLANMQVQLGAVFDTVYDIEKFIGGSDSDSFTGDTNTNYFYGQGGNDVFVIADGDGHDTLDGGTDTTGDIYNATATTNNRVYDLNSGNNGTVTDVTGGNQIDTFTSIENFLGGSGSDTFFVNNVFAGAYEIDGGGSVGVDALNLSNLNTAASFYMGVPQVVIGSLTVNFSDIEVLVGTTDDDIFGSNDGYGDVDMYGGAGFDTFDANGYGNSITFDIASDTIFMVSDTYSVYGIEHFVGAGNGDLFIAKADSNDYSFDGFGIATGTVDFSDASGSITVDLSDVSAQAIGGGFGNYTLANIGNVTGSAHSDTLEGDGFNNDLSGGAGDDVLVGGAGDDVLDGGAGTDIADYSGDIAGITVNLHTGIVTDGSGGSDTLLNIETIIGSTYGDTIDADDTGGADLAQTIYGGAGVDTLTAGSNDILYGGTGNDTLIYSGASAGFSTDYLLDGGDGDDILEFDPGGMDMAFSDGKSRQLIGGAGSDTLRFTGGGGTFNIAPDGTEDTVTGIETIDFQYDFAVNNITIDFRDFMVDSNDGNLLTILVEDSDTIDVDFTTAGGWVLGAIDSYWVEYDKGGFTVRIESETNLTNVTVNGSAPGGEPGDFLSLNGLTGFFITDDIQEGFANAIAALGDLDGDGFDDVGFVKDNNPTDNGRIFILNGQSAPFSHDTLLNMTGISIFEDSGYLNGIGTSITDNMKIGKGGDFNNDGIMDYIIGSPLASSVTGGGTGNAQIIDGSTGNIIMELDRMSGLSSTGQSISFIGDINADGFDDVLIGAPNENLGNGASSGATYVLYGNDMGYQAIDTDAINQQNHVTGGDFGLAADALDVGISLDTIYGRVGFVLIDGAQNQIQMVNLSNPAAPSIIGTLDDFGGSIDITGLTGYSGDGGDPDPLINAIDIIVKGPYLYILSGNSTSGGQITVLDISDPAAPVYVDLHKEAFLQDATAMDMTPAGQLVVVADNVGTGTFRQFDVSPVGILSPHGSPLGNNPALDGAQDVVIHGNYAYVTTSVPGSQIKVIDISGGSPTVGSSVTFTGAQSLHVDHYQNLLYAFSSNNGTSKGELKIYDISSGASPALLGSIADAALLNGTDIVVDHGMAYVTTANGVWAIDVNNAAAPAVIGEIDSGATTADDSATALIADGGLLHVVSGGASDSLVSYDIHPDGFIIEGQAANDQLGENVRGIGDFNGDGLGDFAFTAPGTDTAYLVMAKPGMSALDLAALPPNVIALSANVDPGDISIPTIDLGDINGDGFADIGIVNTGTNNDIDIYFGNAAGTGGVDATISPGGGFEIVGGSGIGDFNGDGYDDSALAVRDLSGNGDQVSIYIIYGDTGISGSIDNTWLNNAANAFKIDYTIPNVAAGDHVVTDFDFELSSAGDINGDGFDDFVIGLPDLDDNLDGTPEEDGAAVVVYGDGTIGGGPGARTIIEDGDGGDLNGGANDVTASASNQAIIGNDLANLLDATGYSNIAMNGGAGDDTFFADTDVNLVVDGGAGIDILSLANASTTLDFSAVGKGKISGIETIDLSTDANQTLVLGLDDIFSLLQQSDDGTLKIDAYDSTTHLTITGASGASGDVNTGDFAGLFGAGWQHESNDGTHEVFSFGAYEFKIDDTLFINDQVSSVI